MSTMRTIHLSDGDPAESEFSRSRARTEPLRSLMRNDLKRQIARARSENPNRENYNQHRCSDERKYSGDAEVAQEESDHQARKNSAQSAPGINKADGSRPNSRREKFSLVGMKARGHPIIHAGQH